MPARGVRARSRSPYNPVAMARVLSRALADYVVEWRRSPWPVPWEEVFGRRAPLALEIGFGNGDFLSAQAQAHPERDHLGLELSWTAATYLFRRLRRVDAGNVRVLLGDAEALLPALFGPATLAEVWVNHPCPWPKARHVERRLLGEKFLALLAERMRTGARLTVVTDHDGYAEWLAGELAAERALESCHPTGSVAAIVGRTPTKYEEKARARGLPIHYFEWRKRACAARPAGRGSSATGTMPTLKLSGAVAGAELFRGFEPALFRERHEGVDVVVKLQTVYRRADEPAWMIEALAQEDRLRQRFGIDVIPRGSTLLLKLSDLGEPHPTHGVKRALWCAARWLQSRHPALVIEQESLGLPAPAERWPG